ncbi:DUF3228 domain-containing protein [Cryptosporidium felis]|nr:DUF3228 domain-containing protein [Cryptosporidium felis]
MMETKPVGINGFALRQFVQGYKGSFIPNIDPKSFLKKVNSYILEEKPMLVDGYAEFCKHIFIPNFTDAKYSVLRITEDNEAYLKSGYVSRREGEVPVLVRWFPANSPPATQIEKGSYLDIILYSKEQCIKESIATNTKMENIVDDLEDDPEWLIISIKVQNEDREIPMEPITMFRNAIIEEGGSGVPLDRDKYLKSVEYWKDHAIVQS